MAFGRLSPHKAPRPMAEINVTPLVDVMLVLLVIFILATPVMASRLALDLPRASVAQPAPEPAAVVRLSRPLAGPWTWNGEPLAPGTLQARLAQAARDNPQTELQLMADTRVPYGEVLALMAQAQAAGLTRVGFVAQPEAQGAAAKP